MAGEASHVVRIPRSDEEGSFILARVSPLGPTSRALDVKLVTTEGVAPYVLVMRHDKIDRLRVKNAPCSSDEWEHILFFLLLGRDTCDNVDATATVQEESVLTITIRRRIQNITQRLGTVSLAYDGDEGIELFDWCGEVVDSRSKIQDDLEKAVSKNLELEKAVGELSNQLDEFLKAKEEDERVLLEKFCTLLNEKKVKIREQHRLLAQAAEKEAGDATDEIVAAKAEIKEDEESLPPASQRTSRRRAGAAPAKPAKRGAKRRAAASEEEEEDSSDGFEQPASRTGRKAAAPKAAAAAAASETDSDDNDDDRTTEHDDESTESEPDEPMSGVEPKEKEEEVQQTKPARRGRAAKKATGKAAAPAAAAAKAPQARETVQKQAEPATEAPPPRRTLAFGRGRNAGGASKPAIKPAIKASEPEPEDSETESDDEL